MFLLALATMMMAGCEKDDGSRFSIKQYDDCEYIYVSDYATLTHKGNCRFCKERRQKELEELIIKLKEK